MINMGVNWYRQVETNWNILTDTVERHRTHLNGDVLGTVADAQGADATSSLLLQAIDNMVVDSTEVVREEELVLV